MFSKKFVVAMVVLLSLAIAVVTVPMVPQNVIVGNVLVSEVVAGSPAENAGLRAGDIILQADGHDVEDLTDLIRLIRHSAGSEIEWMVRSKGGRQELIRVTPRTDPPAWQGRVGILIERVNLRVGRQ